MTENFEDNWIIEKLEENENCGMEIDVPYIGICAEIFVTLELELAFHCSLCKNSNYRTLLDLFTHISQHHGMDLLSKIQDFVGDIAGVTCMNIEPAREASRLLEKTDNVNANIYETFENFEFVEEAKTEPGDWEEPSSEQLWTQDTEKGEVPAFELDGTLFQCEYCSLSFANKRGLASHKASRHKRESFHCDICGEEFTDKKTHMKHRKTHQIRNQKCKLCGFAAFDTASLRSHIHRLHLGGFDCSQCPERFLKKNQLKQHQQTHNTEDTQEVGTSKKSETNLNELTDTVSESATVLQATGAETFEEEFPLKESDSNTDDKIIFKKLTPETNSQNTVCTELFQCDHCGRTFTTKFSMLTHQGNHMKNIKDIPCNICGLLFHKYRELSRHMSRAHKQNEMKQTEYCALKFNTEHPLVNHKDPFPKSYLKEYKCKNCEDVYHNRNEFSSHKKICQSLTNDERIHTCNICGMAFKNQNNLKSHVARHIVPRSFGCSLCPKKFHTKAELQIHERIHRGDRPFMCAECGQGFYTSSHLTKHTRRHTGIRAYKCQLCDKRFWDGSLLKHHMTSHSEERNHVCNICYSRFKSRKALLLHMTMHENKRKHVCFICDRGFNQKQNLTVHLRKVHNIENRDHGVKASEKAT